MNYKSPLRLAMENAMNGNHAFTRNHPKPGETKHYFMKWADDPFSTASDAQIIDVPDDIDPEEFRKNGYQRPTYPSSLSENNLLNNPSGYQSLLSDNGADNFLDESNSYPTSNYNSLTLSNPQSRIQTSLRTPAPTSLTGGLNQNSFDSSSNNFSYPNALGTGGGTSTERMAATLSARETPYNSLSGEETSSMSELSGNSYNSSLSSGFSNNNVPQNEPLWQKLNSLSNTQLNKLTSLIKKAKDEERLYGSSPTKQSLFNLFFGIQQAHAGTLSSMGIENDPIAFKPNSYDFYSQEYTDLIDEIYPDLQFYEGTVEGAYPDSKYLITAGEGYLLNTKERVLKSGVLDELQKKYPDVDVYQMFLKDSEELVDALKERARQNGNEDYLTNNPFLGTNDETLIKEFRKKYPITKEKAKELVYDVYRTERLKPLIQALDQYQINLFELPRPIQRVLMDLDYNPGSSLYRGKGQQSGWHKALTALKKGDYETFLDEISRKGVGHKRNNAVIIRGYEAIDPSIGDVDMESLFKDESVFKFQDKKLSREFIKNNIHIFRPLFLKYQKKKRR